MFQVFAAVHSAVEQSSSRDFSVEVPYCLSNTRSVRMNSKRIVLSDQISFYRSLFIDRLVMHYVFLVVMVNHIWLLFQLIIDLKVKNYLKKLVKLKM